MSETALAVELREGTGKGAARKLRAAGRIPAVLYGQGRAAVNLAIDPRLLDGILSKLGHNALLDLSGDASVAGRTVLVKEVQRDRLDGGLIQVASPAPYPYQVRVNDETHHQGPLCTDMNPQSRGHHLIVFDEIANEARPLVEDLRTRT